MSGGYLLEINSKAKSGEKYFLTEKGNHIIYRFKFFW